MPTIRAIIGPLLLVPSEIEQDRSEATDLIVLRARDMRIGVRMRRPGYAERYPFDFTIRRSRDNGAQTELAKIIAGWGDWLFYGHATKADDIERWFLVDLAAWRAAAICHGARAGNARTKSNGDGTRFTAFDLRHYNRSILISSSHPVPTLGVQETQFADAVSY